MIVDVALPIPVSKTFSYNVPDRWKPFAGRFLRLKVPFHNKTHTGVITSITDGSDPKLKEIQEIIDAFPIIDGMLVELGIWSSEHYITPLGPVLKYVLPPALNIEPYISVQAQENAADPMCGLTLKRAIHIFGREAIFRRHQRGSVTFRDTLTGQTFSPIVNGHRGNEIRKNVLLIGDVRNRLDTYIEAIASALHEEKNVLMLLPDHIAAGSYFKKIFSEQFGDKVLWYGSDTSAKSRMKTFFQVRNKGGFLVLGNKSCVFLPMCRLGLVVVERHEEDEYRNEEGFKFNAVTIAVKRAALSGIPVILGSACPSMEMYHYAGEHNFSVIEKRWLIGHYSEKDIVVPDIVSSAALLEELIPLIREAEEKGEKIAVFTPRKDYGSYLVCHSCRKPFVCPSCEGILGYEKKAGLLVCSSCGTSFPYQERCAHCGSNIIRFSRMGAEYVEEELKDLFPDMTVVKITGDSLKKEIKTVRKMSAGSPAVLIGTQSLSKLYDLHVEKLVLFGWEELRKMAGYRSEEKMIQILVNLIDALTPDSIVLLMDRRNKVSMADYVQCSHYYEEELQKRKNADFPPYQRMFTVEIDKKGKDTGDRAVGKIKDILRKEGAENAMAGALMEKKARYRWKIILKGEGAALHNALQEIYDLPGVQIEADPLYL